jgi:tRNA modification GTPase
MRPDTIYALSSGRPPAAVAIIRISGPKAHAAAERLARALPETRHAALRDLRDEEGELLDQALVLRFDAPASSTGEDVVEFQCHGGRAVVDALLLALSKVDGLREALPGEFTRRAFENGRIDLTEAEGLADLLEAETESQRRAALLMAEGGLRKQIDSWRGRLLDLSAQAEAAIDYVDEHSVDSSPELATGCLSLAQELLAWLTRPRAEPLKDGLSVVIAGPPNAGKSSLLNKIVGYERAIVTDIPGTTRDHIEVPLAIRGIPLRLSDTAGLREADEEVERIGVDRAKSLAQASDILIWVGPPEQAPDHPRRILIHSKADLPERGTAPNGSLTVSSKSGAGIAELLSELETRALTILPSEGQLALNGRQANCLADAAGALGRAGTSNDLVMVAEGLRSARAAFDRLTGRAGVEDLLDSLFGRFCLGK